MPLYIRTVDMNHVGVAIKISIPIIDTELDMMDCTCNAAKECASYYWAVCDFNEHCCTHLYASLHILLHLYNDVWESSFIDVVRLVFPLLCYFSCSWQAFDYKWTARSSIFCLLSVWIPLVSGMILFFRNPEASSLCTRDVNSLCFPSNSALFLRMNTCL